MLRLPPFELRSAESLPEAVGLLANGGAGARLVAGGTELFPRMKLGLEAPPLLIDLGRIPGFAEVTAGPPLRLGAGITLETLTGEAIRRELPALAEAAASVATPQIRAAATLGGNLCQATRCAAYNHSAFWRSGLGDCLKTGGDVCRVAPGSDRCWAVAPSDIAPVLVALRASVEIVGPAAGRFLPVEDMYRNDGLAHLALDPGEIVAAVLVPDAEGWGSAYQKLRLRESLDFQSASAAAALRREGDRVVDARVVIGGVAARPLRCTEAEEALLESTPTDADFTRAAAAAARRAHPVPNADLAAGYRKKMIAPLAARSLREAWRRAGASKPTSGE